MKKILILPDSFKGTMSSRQVGEILAEEASAQWPNAEICRAQVADGGEGTVDAFLSVLPGEKKTVRVQGPHGVSIDSFYGLAGTTAIIEMAAAAGLPLAGTNPNPGLTTTFGVGQLMAAALDAGAEKIVLGLGGSATNDGGTGAAAALGMRFLDRDGTCFIPTGDSLSRIEKIDPSQLDPRLKDVEISVMCDIDNPLCGPTGAAAVFAPQKGASAQQVHTLDQGLLHLAECVRRDFGIDIVSVPGAGAAGGMGAGCIAFFGATLHQGIEVLLDSIHFDTMLNGCSLVLTGEGRIDGQSAHGKVVSGVARRAAKQQVPVVVLAGDIGPDAELLYKQGVSAIFSINRVAVPYAAAKLRAAEDLRQTARTIFRFAQLAKAW